MLGIEIMQCSASYVLALETQRYSGVRLSHLDNGLAIAAADRVSVQQAPAVTIGIVMAAMLPCQFCSVGLQLFIGQAIGDISLIVPILCHTAPIVAAVFRFR